MTDFGIHRADIRGPLRDPLYLANDSACLQGLFTHVPLRVFAKLRLTVNATKSVGRSCMDFPQVSLRVHRHSTDGVVGRLGDLTVVLHIVAFQPRIRTHATSPCHGLGYLLHTTLWHSGTS